MIMEHSLKNTYRGNWNTGREICPLSHYLSQIPHGLAWDWTWASALKGWYSTAWRSVAGHGTFC